MTDLPHDQLSTLILLSMPQTAFLGVKNQNKSLSAAKAIFGGESEIAGN